MLQLQTKLLRHTSRPINDRMHYIHNLALNSITYVKNQHKGSMHYMLFNAYARARMCVCIGYLRTYIYVCM